MNSNRSFLDSLNSGRQRRPRASLEDLNRTLDSLENRIARPIPDERASRHPGEDTTRGGRHDDRFASETADYRSRRPAGRGFDPEQSFMNLARDVERPRERGHEPVAVQENVSRELKALREDLRQQMSSSLRGEFETLRGEIEAAYRSVGPGGDTRALAAEMDRLSSTIQGMAARSDDRGINLLRMDLEQLRDSLAELAREDTVRSMDSRWSEFEKRALSRREPDPAVQALAQRLDQIGSAVANLPDSVALRSLEEKVRTLAGAVDHFSRQSEQAPGKSYEMLEHRLDEISRAIVASSVSAQPHDRESLERIEARVASLAHQLDALADDQGSEEIFDRINALAHRVEDIARQAAMPEAAIDSLTRQVSGISAMLEQGWGSREREAVVDSLERRFAEIARYIDERHQLTGAQSQALFRELDQRLESVASRLDQPAPGIDPDMMRAFDARFAELGQRIDAARPSPQQAQMLDGLNRRVAELSQTIEKRVDEPAPTDPKLLRALDQRFSDLTQRIDAVRHSPQQAQMLDNLDRRMAELSQAFDARAAEPAPTDPKLLQALDARFLDLGERIEANRPSPLQGQLLDGLNRRLAELSDKFERREARQAATDPALLQALDERFSDLSDRIAAVRPADGEAIEGLERRLDAISDRIETSERNAPQIDPAVIRNLESQVSGLAAHLAKPPRPMASLETFLPRLEGIERSIGGQRDAIIAAAREAAEHAVRALGSADSDSDDAKALTADLKSLESLARRADEKNSRTFEAIHDTLLKVVDRLGALENRSTSIVAEHRAKLAAASVPPMTPQTLQPIRAPEKQPEPAQAATPRPAAKPGKAETKVETKAEAGAQQQRRSPSEAAAAAAKAAAKVPAARTEAEPRKASMLSGLKNVLARRKEAAPAAAVAPAKADPVLPGMDEIGIDEPLDAQAADKPLEPGSGAPDLNAIMRRVRDKRGAAAKQNDLAAAKADFIAAARRAAQAAAAEAETFRKASAPGKAKSKFSPADFLRAKRKPILMAAAAIMIALAGLQLGKAFLDRDAGMDTAALQPVAAQPAAPLAAAAPDMAETDDEFAPVEDDTAMVETGEAVGMDEESEAAAPRSAEATAPEPAPPAAAPVAAETETAEPAPAAPQPAATAAIPDDAGPLPLREAAQGGDAKALFEIASRYADGRNGAPDTGTAAKWYSRAADLGFAPAQYRIGNYFEKGIGVERDIVQAKTWYQLAANQGNASAMHNLAVLFAMGADGTADNDSAARWFVKAAELGVKDSQYNLGILAAKGAGVPQSLEESYKWFALVAKTGDKDAAAKRDEVANALRPEQLAKARAAAELWKPKPVVEEANSVDVPESWRESAGTTASIDMKKAVKTIQLILNKNGYDAGGADGVMGAKTKQAIASFQKASGMTPTGEVDEKLVQALLAKK